MLGVVAGWFIKSQSKSTIDAREGNFAVKDVQDITKVVLTDVSKNRVELKYTNGKWFVNGKYEARPDLVDQLNDAITHVTSLAPVPSNAHNKVVTSLMSEHVRVEVFDKDNDLLKCYWVGGATADGKNTYMLLETNGKPAARPHMTYIPGFRGYLTSRYNTDAETWRSRVVFNYSRSDIKNVTVDYSQDAQKSFSVTQIADDSFSVAPLDDKYRIHEVYLQKYVRQYLDFYSSVYLEAFDNSYSLRDSVINIKPLITISVTDKNNKINVVKMFHMPRSKRSKTQFDNLGNYLPYDIDHYHATVNNGQDFAIVQHYVFGKLLRNYRDFFFRPATQ